MLARFLDDIIKLNLGGKPDSNRNNEDTESAEEAQRTVCFLVTISLQTPLYPLNIL